MNYSVEFTFAINEEVTIIDLKLVGRVIGVCKKVNGCTYNVLWWAEAARHDEWLYGFELKALNGNGVKK